LVDGKSLFELTPNTFFSVVCFLFLQAITTINATVDSSVLVYNRTGELPGNLLEQYPEITSLQATNLELTGLSYAFQTKHYKLKHLDLSHNHLSKLDYTCSFIGLKILETLSLANNRLEKLESFGFYGLEKLQSLNLSHNRLQHLDAPVFYYVKEVRELKLDHNQLDIVNFMLFAKMVKMALLDLSNNQIKKIQYHPQYKQFGMSHSLEHLDLGLNHLESFNLNEIPNFGNLTQLDLQGNNLTNLTTGELGQRFPKLKTINISGHKLDSATLETFRNYSESNGIHLVLPPEEIDYTNAMIVTIAFFIVIICVVTFGIWLQHACSIRRYRNGVYLDE
jgi:Leucine-rich repeat (LRR) protein